MRHFSLMKRRRGVTFVELMVASLLVAIGLGGLVHMWAFSFQVTVNNEDIGMAYNLGNQRMEAVKIAGFANAPEGTTSTYYDGNEMPVAAGATAALYRLDVNIVSSAVTSGTAGMSGAVPADTALRTVTITGTVIPSGKTLYRTYTYLAKGGV